MGLFKAIKKAAKGDLIGATTEMLPDSIKEGTTQIISKTANDYLESGDVKSIGKSLLNNTATQLSDKQAHKQNQLDDIDDIEDLEE